MHTEITNNHGRVIDPVTRFRWAISFQDITPVAGKVLAALADHADQRKLTCWPSVETLGRETRVSERGVRYALRSLEAIGAIFTERSRGRTSSVYRLAIPANHAISAPFNPAESEPNPARLAPFNPASLAPQQSQSFEQSKKQKKQQQPARVRETGENQTAAASQFSTNTSKPEDARHACPVCGRTWPMECGTTCYGCQHDVARAQRNALVYAEHPAELDAGEADLLSQEVEDKLSEEAKPPISETAERMNAAIGGSLPGGWLYNPELGQLIGNRNFMEVCETMIWIGTNKLPTPEMFFSKYTEHRMDHRLWKDEFKTFLPQAKATTAKRGGKWQRVPPTLQVARSSIADGRGH